MAVRKNELVKQLEYSIDGLQNSVFVHIYKSLDNDHMPYSYDISHHYGKDSIYYPSSISGKTIEEVESNIDSYVSGFTEDAVIEKNEKFAS